MQFKPTMASDWCLYTWNFMVLRFLGQSNQSMIVKPNYHNPSTRAPFNMVRFPRLFHKKKGQQSVRNYSTEWTDLTDNHSLPLQSRSPFSFSLSPHRPLYLLHHTLIRLQVGNSLKLLFVLPFIHTLFTKRLLSCLPKIYLMELYRTIYKIQVNIY